MHGFVCLTVDALVFVVFYHGLSTKTLQLRLEMVMFCEVILHMHHVHGGRESTIHLRSIDELAHVIVLKHAARRRVLP